MILVILFAGINLGPEEAQYWTWSRHLDWGYYSKPPGIAWEIWLGTQIAGNTELGVRLGALVLGFLLPLAVYRTAKLAGLGGKTAFWSGAVLALSPVGVISSFLSTTDAGMVFFWTLAFGELVRTPEPHYRKAGGWIFLSALFKWTGFLFWAAAAIGAALSPSHRKKSLIKGILISSLALLPSLIWNLQHDFATFKHVGGQMLSPSGGAPPKPNFFEFLGAQAALISPIFFLLYLLATGHLVKRWKTIPFSLRLIGLATGLFLIAYCLQAAFKKMQGNWCVFIFPTMAVLIARYAVEGMRHGKKWMIGGSVLSVACAALVLAVPALQRSGLISSPPLRKYPLKECIGWGAMERRLSEFEEPYFISDTYQMASLLSFYSPGQKRAYFFNIEGRRKNQFSYWPSMQEEQAGNAGIFVWSGYSPVHEKQGVRLKEKLLPYFENVDFLGSYPIYSIGGGPQKIVLLFRCLEYNGKAPEAPLAY